MDMYSRNQYLKELRKEYSLANCQLPTAKTYGISLLTKGEDSTDKRLDLLYRAYQKKETQKVKLQKRLKPNSVSFLIAQPKPISVS